jgi:hypothetical protein
MMMMIIIQVYVRMAGPSGREVRGKYYFGLSNSGIMGSNPTRGMDVCPRFSVLCCPVCK